MNRPTLMSGEVARLTLLWWLAGVQGATGQGMSGLYPLFLRCRATLLSLLPIEGQL